MQVNMLQQRAATICTEIGQMEFNHREQINARHDRLRHIAREIEILQGAKQ